MLGQFWNVVSVQVFAIVFVLAIVPFANAAEKSMGEKATEIGEKASEIGKGAADVVEDSSITALIKGKFLSQKELESFDIHVKTTDGVVALTGTVDHKAQSALAESLAQGTKGVKKVENLLKVK